ncbi:MAG: type II secretion system F family protein [Alphaproteobacteria bacterium]
MLPDAPIPADLLVLVGGILSAIFLVLSMVGGGVYALKFSPRARLRRRVAAIADSGGSGVVERGERASGLAKRKLIQAKLKELEESQKKSKRPNRVRQMLLEAGLNLSVHNFHLLSATMALIGAGIYLLTGFIPAGAILVAIPSGLLLPRWILGYLANRRKQAFTAQFADAVDVIVRGIQSGLPVGECFNIIARESHDPVGSEFRLISEAQRLGLTMDSALARSTERMPTPELKFFAIVMGIQQQTGGNLAETLSNLSRVLRDRKKMADKVRALSSEARTTAMIIGSLPFLMTGLLFLTSPDYIIHLFTDTIGHVLIGAGLTLMLTGSLIMKKMISFEI